MDTYKTLDFDLDAFKRFGGRSDALPYIEPAGLYNDKRRLYVDAAQCKNFEKFKTRSDIAKAGYYMRYSLFKNDYVYENRSPMLVADPAFMVEVVSQKYITDPPVHLKLWLNVLIKDEEAYTITKIEGEKTLKEMQALLDRLGDGLAQLQPDWDKTHTASLKCADLKGVR